MTTIKDVARRAGVSTATVSRVINESGYYDAGTARRVRRAIEELSYRGNVHWKRLKRNASETICFLLGNRASMNSMQMKLLMACERGLQEAGYDLVFALFRYRPATPAAGLSLPRLLVHDGAVDGVILAGVHYANLLDALARRKLAHVVLGNTLIGPKDKLKWDAIIYDDVAGAYEAAKYLARLGHRRIAFAGNTTCPWFRRRQQGYLKAIREERLEPLTLEADWKVSNIEYGQLAAAELLRWSDPVTAVLAGNDEIAGGLWKELVRRRVAIPDQVSLMGFGDREEFSILEPPLTTVSVFQETLGAELTRMLLEKLKRPGARTKSRTFPCQVIERGSCAAPRRNLALVGKA